MKHDRHLHLIFLILNLLTKHVYKKIKLEETQILKQEIKHSSSHIVNPKQMTNCCLNI